MFRLVLSLGHLNSRKANRFMSHRTLLLRVVLLTLTLVLCVSRLVWHAPYIPGDAVYSLCAGEFSNVSGSSVALKVGGIVSFASRAN